MTRVKFLGRLFRLIKKLLALLLAALLLVFSVSCGKDTVYSHAELIIGLDSDFKEVENRDFDVTYSNGKYMVAVLRISYVAGMLDGIPETMTTLEFGELWLTRCMRVATVMSGEITYAEYYSGIGAEEHYYFEAFYRSKYAYFAVIFATPEIFSESLREEFLAYTETVIFNYDK